ncbi:cellulose biosynthesis protein BcsC [Cupriavidus sp. USMAHM13]|uniref:cellulose biosynthesis protein BcsC n=1 Tax=Cupriavidus sp. USMAHM13 TaxID=1389192 RepID=UPI000A91FE52|nr:cellulose biosynthesis protein BcsC [Cupriavidus sp. USMAHM13]
MSKRSSEVRRMSSRRQAGAGTAGGQARPAARSLLLGLMAMWSVSAAAQEDPVKLLTDQGKFWQARGRSDRAIEAWQKILRLDPNQPDALYGMGVAELEAGRADSARTYLDRLRKAKPDSPLAGRLDQAIRNGGSAGTRQQVEQARQLARAGQSEEAVKRYQQAAGGAAPQGDLALEYYQTLGGTAQGWEQARKGLEQLVRDNPGDVRAQLALAQHLTYRENTRREGIRQLEALSKRSDVGTQASESWRRALTWLGGRPADAPLFQTWLATHPDDTAVRAKLDAIARAQQQAARAEAPSADPVRKVVQEGFRALDAGNLEGADTAFRNALSQRPGDADALGGMGVLRLKQEKFAEAADFFEQAERRGAGARYRSAHNSADYWMLMEQANAARDAGNRAEARKLLERATKLDANQPAAQVALADVLATDGQYAAAEAGYRRVLRQQPDNPDATRGLVDVLAAQNKNAEALAVVERLTPQQQDKVGSLGKLRAEQARIQAREALARGDTAAARRAMEDAMAADPTDPWVRLEVARAYVAMGQPEQARGVMDGLLMSNPDQPDVLFASALLAAETGRWQSGLDALERIPPQNRTREMGNLQRRLWVHAEAERAAGLAAAGQPAAALNVLQQAERYAQRDADQLGALALAYADAGDETHALMLMRSVIGRTAKPDVGVQLQYAAILLKTKQDVELAGLLRQLLNAPMNAPQRRDYDSLRVAYIVRQADQLTEANDLVAAYDTLAPALSERPGDAAVRGSLARMYAKAGEGQKALTLYEGLIEKDPRNLDLLLSAVGAAGAAKEFSRGEAILQMALAQAPKSPRVLTEAGRFYRTEGKPTKAMDYFRAAVAAENAAAAQAGAAMPGLAPARPGSGFDRVPGNPFVGLPGQRGTSQLPVPGSNAPYAPMPAPVAAQAVMQPASLPAAPPAYAQQGYGQPYIPVPQQQAAQQAMQAPGAYYPAAGAGTRATTASRSTGNTRNTRAAAAPAVAPVTAGYAAGYAAAPAAAPLPANASPAQAYAAAVAAPQPVAVPARQPLGAQSRLPWLSDNDSQEADTNTPRTAQQELQDLQAQRSPMLAGGPMLRGRSGDSGMSQMMETQVVAEGRMPAGNGKLVARVTPVTIDAGSVGTDYNSAYRFGAGPLVARSGASAGNQSAFGAAVGVAYESERINADVGSTPLGFQYADVNAGVKVNLPVTQRTTLSLAASRRPVTDSVLSYSGAQDTRAGLRWGGVMNSSGRADLGWDDGTLGIYGYGGYGLLTGHDVARNTRWEGGGGFYIRLLDTPEQRWMGGINFTSMGYADNLRYFTFGQGGYFSPQRYFAVTLPMSLSGRSGKIAYHIRGALGVQSFSENDSNFFPTNAAAQSAANSAVASANAAGLTNATSAVYPGQSKTGLAYNLVGSMEYQASQQMYVGGLFGIDNARDYRQWYAGVYLRYALQRQTGPLQFPPAAPQSAVGPLPF